MDSTPLLFNYARTSVAPGALRTHSDDAAVLVNYIPAQIVSPVGVSLGTVPEARANTHRDGLDVPDGPLVLYLGCRSGAAALAELSPLRWAFFAVVAVDLLLILGYAVEAAVWNPWLAVYVAAVLSVDSMGVYAMYAFDEPKLLWYYVPAVLDAAIGLLQLRSYFLLGHYASSLCGVWLTVSLQAALRPSWFHLR